jgi:AcrR family transcriptional regulator
VSAPERSRKEAKRETRAALIRAGLAAFSEQGLDAPSLDAICARAGYTRGAFYVHFAGREEFIVAVMETVLGDFLDAVIGAGSGGADLEATILRFASALVEGNPVTGAPGSMRTHQLIDVCSRSPRVRERFLAMLAEAQRRVESAAKAGQDAGTVRDDVSAASLAAVLVTLAMGVVQMFELGAPLSPEDVRATIVRVLSVSGRRAR